MNLSTFFNSPFLVRVTRPSPLAAFGILGIVCLVFFAPVLPTYFLTDDYNYVYHLLVNARAYVQGEQLGKWFIDFSAQGMQVPELSIFFRPVVQWLWLFDFIAYGTDALGYHLTNILLHISNSFLVYIVAWQILRHRASALVAGLLFALHPVHADSVAWIADRTDVLSTFFYFSSAAFFIFYRQRSRRLFAIVSIAAFALAIGTKENTVALPLILLAYDGLFAHNGATTRVASTVRKILTAQIPYWIVLAVYVGLRFFFFGQFGRNTGGGFLSYGIELFFQYYTLALLQPFFADMNTNLLSIIFAFFALLFALYRDRRALWFGVLWIGISLLPSMSAAYVAPRLAYAPSAGLALALAAILPRPFPKSSGRRFSRSTPSEVSGHAPPNGDVGAAATGLEARWGLTLVSTLLTLYSFGLWQRVDNWTAVGTVARIIPEQTKQLYPTLPPDARLYYNGVPMILRGIYLYNENFPNAIQIAYRMPNLWVQNSERFPIVTQNLDRAIFLDYRRRVVSENKDVRRVLEERARCATVSSPAAAWEFVRDAQGWEAWNELEDVRVAGGVLTARATGNDPYLGSPTIDVPALNIGEIEIEMSVRADAAQTRGAVYWLIAGQSDFVPDQFAAFEVLADGAYRKYRVDILASEKLFIGDRIARLRFDPTATPAEIAIKAIRVFVHCNTTGDSCKCSP